MQMENVLHEYQIDEKKSPLEARPAWENSSVLLKLFISGNERWNTADVPLRMSGTLFLNVNNIQAMISEDQNNLTTQW